MRRFFGMRIEVDIETKLKDSQLKKLIERLSLILSKNGLTGTVKYYPTRVHKNFGFKIEEDDFDLGLGEPEKPVETYEPREVKDLATGIIEKTTAQFKKPPEPKKKGFLTSAQVSLTDGKTGTVEMGIEEPGSEDIPAKMK